MRKIIVTGCAIAMWAGCSSETKETGATPDGGLVTDSGTGVDGGGGCAFGEPNDTRETPTAIQVNQVYRGLCVSAEDGTDGKDFYAFTAPATDLAGGYVEVKMTNVGPEGLAEFIVTSVVDNDVLVDNYQTTEGAGSYGWFTVTPGATYRVQANRFAGAGKRFTYDLELKYTAIADAFEPNNTKETAKDLALNTPVKGSAASHSASTNLVPTDAADWFKVTLPAGTATVTLSTVPIDFTCDVELFDSYGTGVGEKYNTTAGADCQLDATDLVGGVYYVNVHQFAGVPVRAAGGIDVPAFVKGQYTLTAK